MLGSLHAQNQTLTTTASDKQAFHVPQLLIQNVDQTGLFNHNATTNYHLSPPVSPTIHPIPKPPILSPLLNTYTNGQKRHNRPKSKSLYCETAVHTIIYNARTNATIRSHTHSPTKRKLRKPLKRADPPVFRQLQQQLAQLRYPFS